MAEDPQEKKPFYEKLETPTGETARVIASPEAAHELADMEDQVRAREEQLREWHETGYTEGQRKNIQIMDELGRKHPHAFIDSVDKEGRRFMLLNYRNTAMRWRTADRVILSPWGHALVATQAPPWIDESNISQMLDALEKPKAVPFNWWEQVGEVRVTIPGGREGETRNHPLSLKRIDFSDPHMLKELKELFSETEQEQIAHERGQAEAAAKLEPQSIVDQL